MLAPTAKQEAADPSREGQQPDEDARVTEVLLEKQRHIRDVDVYIIPGIMAHEGLVRGVGHIAKGNAVVGILPKLSSSLWNIY